MWLCIDYRLCPLKPVIYLACRGPLCGRGALNPNISPSPPTLRKGPQAPDRVNGRFRWEALFHASPWSRGGVELGALSSLYKVCVCVCVHVCGRIFISVSVCRCMYTRYAYICMYVYIYIYIFVCISLLRLLNEKAPPPPRKGRPPSDFARLQGDPEVKGWGDVI